MTASIFKVSNTLGLSLYFCATKSKTYSCFSHMKQLFFAVAFIAALAFFTQSACYYDNEVEQYGITPCDTVAVNYNEDIQTIIQSNCVTCHGPGGEQELVPFDTYNGLKIFAASLVDRVNGTGVALMPPSGAISDCNKQKIEAWVKAGAPEN